jgi:hypothetical protein
MDFEEKKTEAHNINIYLLVLFLYPPEISLDVPFKKLTSQAQYATLSYIL